MEQHRQLVGTQPAHLVTASALVRQFGVWQERAAQAPVYILHRGRPRLALLSVEILEALISPAASNDQGSLVDVLDATRLALIVLDTRANIVATSSAARAQLGAALPIGGSLLAVSGDSAPALDAALARVLASGIEETAEIMAPRDPRRRIALVIAAIPSGLLVSITDSTVLDDFRELSAVHDAELEAGRATGLVARARITLRGYLAEPNESLAAMTGLGLEALATARFASLFDVTTRVDVGTAIERLIDSGTPLGLSARLLVNRGDPRSVRIGLAPIRRGAAAIEGVCATIVRAGGGDHEG